MPSAASGAAAPRRLIHAGIESRAAVAILSSGGSAEAEDILRQCIALHPGVPLVIIGVTSQDNHLTPAEALIEAMRLLSNPDTTEWDAAYQRGLEHVRLNGRGSI